MYTVTTQKEIGGAPVAQQHMLTHVEQLLDWFEKLQHEERSKKDGPTMGMFATITESGLNTEEREIIFVHAIVLDLNSITWDEVEVAFERLAGFHYFTYTTYSHTPEHPRFRIIVPLDTAVSPEEYVQKKLASRLAQKLGISAFAVVSNNPVEMHYMPAHPKDGEFASEVNRGTQTFSVDDLPVPKASSGKGKRPAKDGDGHDELVAEAMRVVKHAFKDNIIFNSGRFHHYENGIWHENHPDEFFQHMLVHVYGLKQTMSNVQKIIDMMKVLNLKKEFPSCATFDDIIVLKNCAVDPAAGQAMPHSPDHFARNTLGFDFDPKATCPLWESTLREIWRDDTDREEKILLLQEFIGYSLIRSVRFQKMIWLIGAGANGKSVILDVLGDLVGAANLSAVPFSKFGQRFTLVQLLGKLVNISAEISSTAVLADSELKAVVAGDIVTMERKMEQPFSAKLFVKLWAAANILPKTKDHSHGFFRRIFLLTFNRVFSPMEQDKELVTKLKQELPGIFNWSLSGLHRLLQNDGFTVPASSVSALDEYRTDSNSVALFMRDHLVSLPDSSTSPSSGTRSFDVYATYVQYCRSNGYAAVSNAEFGKRLTLLGIKGRKSNGKMFYPVQVVGTEIYNSSLYGSPSPSSRERMADLEEEFGDS